MFINIIYYIFSISRQRSNGTKPDLERCGRAVNREKWILVKRVGACSQSNSAWAIKPSRKATHSSEGVAWTRKCWQFGNRWPCMLMPGWWGVNTVVIHGTTQHSWSVCELPHTGRPQCPLFLSVPAPSQQGPPPSLQRTIISYSDIWRWTLSARKEVFQIGLRNQILLLQQDTGKKTRGRFMRAERMKSVNRKILRRKAKHPQNAAQSRVFAEKMLEGQGCGRGGRGADPHVRNCSLSSVLRGFNISPG